MKYMLTLIDEEDDREDGDATPEQMEALMNPWADFDRQLLEAGAFVAGEGLHPSSTASTVKVSESGERTVTDGPFAETKEQLGGFYLIECGDLDAALEWAKQVPVRPGGSIEVRPTMDFTEFGYPDPYKIAAGAS
jgi:hypothetical protein